jgi:hypothetical protein
MQKLQSAVPVGHKKKGKNIRTGVEQQSIRMHMRGYLCHVCNFIPPSVPLTFTSG